MANAKKILVVDDDPDIVEQVTLIMQQDGHEVYAAGTEAEAEEILLSVKPDLAILDLMMEEKDSGFVLCHRIKKLYPDTPVMMVTAVKAATGLSFAADSAVQQSWLKADLLDGQAHSRRGPAQRRERASQSRGDASRRFYSRLADAAQMSLRTRNAPSESPLPITLQCGGNGTRTSASAGAPSAGPSGHARTCDSATMDGVLGPEIPPIEPLVRTRPCARFLIDLRRFSPVGATRFGPCLSG
jgi:CheY-like chemotaxis protein